MDQQDKSPVIRIHAEIALKRWQGGRGRGREVDEEGGGPRPGGRARSTRGPALAHAQTVTSTRPLPIVERDLPDSALRFTTRPPSSPAWRWRRSATSGTTRPRPSGSRSVLVLLRRDWEDADSERFDVLTVASFLKTRGEDEEAMVPHAGVGEDCAFGRGVGLARVPRAPETTWAAASTSSAFTSPPRRWRSTTNHRRSRAA